MRWQRPSNATAPRGLRPFCVVATVGTTSTTSIDPVEAIADIAERHGLWLHVDAAYAGVAAIAPEFQHILKGCERADSLVINPHKWLFTPVDLSVLYTRRPDILRRAFSLVPEYLRTADDPRAVNYMDYGVPLGRRFRALKLWFVLRYYGREGIAEIIRNAHRWAQELARQIDADERFERTAPTPFSTVCFRLKRRGRGESRAARTRERLGRSLSLAHRAATASTACASPSAISVLLATHVQRAWELVRDERGLIGPLELHSTISQVNRSSARVALVTVEALARGNQR